ncbi:MAG: ABC-ATPase UvrA [Planctomycetota bacterium]|nr:ABC-ATPase UvrA [Planctomycetota bacterium]
MRVTGARTHNLKNITIEIPRDQLVVFTGVSGSGKSSLAYDTIYAEGQRRYLESVSTYSRAFVERIERPDVDRVEGLPPTVSVSQQVGSVRPRSTLATTTEIYDFLRLIYARAGVAHSPATGSRVERQSADQVAEAVLRFGDRAKIMVLAPLVRGRKGAHQSVFEKIAKDGFVRARVDGEIVDTAEPPKLAKTKVHTIEAVVDRLVVKEGIRPRLRESVELALKLGDGLCVVSRAEGDAWVDRPFSEKFVCPDSGESFAPLEPRSFSFNSPYGACPACEGLGAVVPEDLRRGRGRRGDRKNDLAAEMLPLAPSHPHLLPPCPICNGERLNAFSRGVTLDGVRLPELTAMAVTDSLTWCSRLIEKVRDENASLDLTVEARLATAKALPEAVNRLRYLERVGLGYLTLDRPTKTLSGGEYQRARLSGCLGAGLIGVGYVLDEPTIGLHPRDIGRLIDTLRDLRDAGNSVLIVEHDLAVIAAADHVIDLGPGAGADGGLVVAAGTPAEIAANPESPTGPYLRAATVRERMGSRRENKPLPDGRGSESASPTRTARPRPVTQETPCLRLSNIRRHNLANIDVSIPLGRFVAVTGVSGSGKSTLVMDVLVPAVKQVLAGNRDQWPGAGDQEEEILPTPVSCLLTPNSLQRLVPVDQSPLGRTSRSTPATYSGVWDEIRKVFATTKESRLRGFKASRFSYASSDGRCPDCKGQGTQKIEMKFLPDVFVTCPTCEGRRFNRQTLSITFHGKTAADVLAMRIDEAVAFFDAVPKVRERLATLAGVGLGYVELGQSALTLSGGEAQRVRLATELGLPGKIGAAPTLFVLDEPTTGLHPRDIERLVDLLQRLVDDGHTVLVIEHEPAVIASADWVIDLGPEGGAGGGRLVAACSPAELMKISASHTGRAIAAYFS